MLAEARTRIRNAPGKYVNHIYGEKEVGGTSKLYISGVPFAQLGFPTLGEKPVGRYAGLAMDAVPPAIVGVAAVMAGFYWVIRRREDMSRQTFALAEADQHPEPDPNKEGQNNENNES